MHLELTVFRWNLIVNNTAQYWPTFRTLKIAITFIAFYVPPPCNATYIWRSSACLREQIDLGNGTEANGQGDRPTTIYTLRSKHLHYTLYCLLARLRFCFFTEQQIRISHDIRYSNSVLIFFTFIISTLPHLRVPHYYIDLQPTRRFRSRLISFYSPREKQRSAVCLRVRLGDPTTALYTHRVIVLL